MKTINIKIDSEGTDKTKIELSVDGTDTDPDVLHAVGFLSFVIRHAIAAVAEANGGVTHKGEGKTLSEAKANALASAALSGLVTSNGKKPIVV